MSGQLTTSRGSFTTNERVLIDKLILSHTGTYEDQYRRPFTFNCATHVVDELRDRLTGNSAVIQPSLFSSLTNDFIRPAAERDETPVSIIHGFGQRRYKFLLILRVVDAMSESYQMVSGYTEHDEGITIDNRIDPKWVFYINSVVTMRDEVIPSDYGNRTRRAVSGAYQVLSNNDFSSIYNSDQQYRMRPADMFSATDAVDMVIDGSLPDDSYNNCFTNTQRPVASRRTNVIPSQYAALTLEKYRVAKLSEALGQTQADILNSARGSSLEKALTTNPFFMALRNYADRRGEDNSFQFRDLQYIDIDHNLEKSDRIVVTESAKGRNFEDVPHVRGYGNSWDGASADVLLAYSLSQAVPAIMLTYGIGEITAQISNRTHDMGFEIRVLKVTGFTNNLDLSEYGYVVANRVVEDVIMEQIDSGRMDIALELDVRVLADSRFEIELNGSERTHHYYPQFCDSLNLPLVTDSRDLLFSNASQIRSLLDQVVDGQEQGFSYDTEFSRI